METGKEKDSSKKYLFIAIIALCVCFLVGVFLFAPDAVNTVLDKFSEITSSASETQLVNISIGDFNINLNGAIELPTFNFNIDVDEAAIPQFDVSIFIIIAAVIAMIISCSLPVVSLLTTLAFSGVGLYIAIQAVEVYNNMVASGRTTWNAAGSCFLVMFAIMGAIVFNGLLGIEGTILQITANDKANGTALAVIWSLIFAVIISFVLAGLGWFILGCGWFGGIYVTLAIAFIYSMWREIVNLSVQGLQ